MRSPRLLPFLAALILLPLPFAFGHGGTFRGPNGGVPPGLREPHDPEPPPPPPSEPGDGPTPITQFPDPGHEGGTTGGGNGPEPPRPPDTGRGNAKTKSALTFENWRFWWAYNNDDILNLRAPAAGVGTVADAFAFANEDRENRVDALRPTRREVEMSVLPALLRCIDREDEHEDVHGGALIASAKMGSHKLIRIYEPIIWNRYRNADGREMDFGGQATESAVLALGLVPDLDDASRAQVRRTLLAAVADDALRTRERAWAAVSLGLQRDAEAARPLLDLLVRRYPDDNVPAGILAGVGLTGDRSVRPELEEILIKGRFRGAELSGRVRGFAAYALLKLGDVDALPAILQVLKSRRQGALLRRPAALAAGALGEIAPDAAKAEAVDVLLRTLSSPGCDGTTASFALISLGRIGTDRAVAALLDAAENAPYMQRPFAGLSLATRVFYTDRAAAQGTGAPLEPVLRQRIVDKLARLSDRARVADMKAAFLLCRGLVKDRAAAEEMIAIVRAPGDPMLRGFACVALGLLGDAREEVKDALRCALAERKGLDLRRDAATGLGLLRDARTVPYLLDELRKATSFAVQAQLITAIGTIGDQRALAPLATLLEDRSQPPQVRALAAVGLGMIGDPRPLPPLARLSRDYNYRGSVADLDELLFIF